MKKSFYLIKWVCKLTELKAYNACNKVSDQIPLLSQIEWLLFCNFKLCYISFRTWIIFIIFLQKLVCVLKVTIALVSVFIWSITLNVLLIINRLQDNIVSLNIIQKNVINVLLHNLIRFLRFVYTAVVYKSQDSDPLVSKHLLIAENFIYTFY